MQTYGTAALLHFTRNGSCAQRNILLWATWETFLEQFDPKKKYEKLRAEAKDLSDEQLEELHMNSKLTHLKILKAYKRFQEYLHVLYPDNFDVKEIPVDKFKHIPLSTL